MSSSDRVYNFGAGPSAPAAAILNQAREELLNWRNSGLSVMEMSHRGDDFISIAEHAEHDLRDLLAVPRNYAVLFLQGGGSQQFSQVPLNLLPEGGRPDYIDTGIWSGKAMEAARQYGDVHVAEVLIREDLLGNARAACPAMLNYQLAAQHGSMYNTPPTFAWYMAGLVFQWLKAQGGLAAIAKINKRKQQRLYGCIDASSIYVNRVAPAARSWMNVPFRLADERLDPVFLAGADAHGLLYLKGHRSKGGMRASINNAVSEEAVEALVVYMTEFERKYG